MKKILLVAILAFFPLLEPLRAATDEQVELLASGFGAATSSHLTESYLSLVGIEKGLSAKPTTLVKLHLKVQASLLELQSKDFDKLSAAFPDDKEFQAVVATMKEASAAIAGLNGAISAYVDGETKTLEEIRKKHAAAKKVIVRLLELPEEGKDWP